MSNVFYDNRTSTIQVFNNFMRLLYSDTKVIHNNNDIAFVIIVDIIMKCAVFKSHIVILDFQPMVDKGLQHGDTAVSRRIDLPDIPAVQNVAQSDFYSRSAREGEGGI